MRTRSARVSDLAAITALQARDDLHWFGDVEHDEDEVREELEPVPDLVTQSLLVIDDAGEVIGATWWWGVQTTVLAGPGPDRPAVIDMLLDHLRDHDVNDVFALSRDAELVDAITARGWVHTHSGFDLLRAVNADWELPEPAWPEGVELTGATEDELPALHSLVYDAAGWAEVSGHVRREFDEWRTLFVRGTLPSPEQLVARRGGRPIGLALTRTFSDGTGWISQLAVDRAERDRGVGRALLLAGLRGRRNAGAVQLGLGVQAANAGALRLYESVGLRIEREYRAFERATATN